MCVRAREQVGDRQQADRLYAEAHSGGIFDHRLKNAFGVHVVGTMDLHRLIASVARAAVRFVLADLRWGASASSSTGELNIITGV